MYLPLSDNSNLNKALGTRHKAGVGISEVTDSMTIIVSEETGSGFSQLVKTIHRCLMRIFLETSWNIFAEELLM